MTRSTRDSVRISLPKEKDTSTLNISMVISNEIDTSSEELQKTAPQESKKNEQESIAVTKQIDAMPSNLLSTSNTNVRQSSKFGTVNYSIDEMIRLNTKVLAILPVGSEDWIHVAYQYNYMRPESIPYREVDSLKRKFKKMYCTRATSGKFGTTMPEYIREAKVIRRLINQKSEQRVSSNNEENRFLNTQQNALERKASSNTKSNDTAVLSHGIDGVKSKGINSTQAAKFACHNTGGQSIDQGDNSNTNIGSTTMHTLCSASQGLQTSTLYFNPQENSPSTPNKFPQSTSDVISMLKLSIERKKRTSMEEMLSESDRVRKERKKRKMESVFSALHNEYHGNKDTAIGQSIGQSSPSHDVRAQVSATNHVNNRALPTLMEFKYGADNVQLEMILLQYMIVQQQEQMQRDERDRLARDHELKRKEKRRAEKARIRAKEKRELMLLMKALLNDKFPKELQHYVGLDAVDTDETIEVTSQDIDVTTQLQDVDSSIALHSALRDSTVENIDPEFNKQSSEFQRLTQSPALARFSGNNTKAISKKFEV